jgi:hypothetical protein
MSDDTKAKKLLEEQNAYFRSKNWIPEIYVKADGFHFSIQHSDGSRIVDCYQALQLVYDALREEDDDGYVSKPPMTDEQILFASGYEMLCESPLEITSTINPKVFISGFSANLLLSTLRQNYRNS